MPRRTSKRPSLMPQLLSPLLSHLLHQSPSQASLYVIQLASCRCCSSTNPVQPTKLKGPFLEQFTDDWDTRWKPSHAKKEKEKGAEEEWAYVGNWAVEEPTVFSGMIGDKGLVVKDKAAHHAISAKFAKPINPKGKPLVVQYEVKLQGKTTF